MDKTKTLCYGMRIKTGLKENGEMLFQDVHFGAKAEDPDNPGQLITIDERLNKLKTIHSYQYDISLANIDDSSATDSEVIGNEDGSRLFSLKRSFNYREDGDGFDNFSFLISDFPVPFSEINFIDCFYYQGNEKKFTKLPYFECEKWMTDNTILLQGSHWAPFIFKDNGDFHLIITVS